MRGPELTGWEVRSAILSGRAETLRCVAGDGDLPLTDAERALVLAVARKLTAEAHAVVVGSASG